MTSIRVQNKNLVLDRLTALREKSEPDSPAMRRALTISALLITNQAKLNIRRHGLIDTGRLSNSLRWEFYRPDGPGLGIRIGSFGVPYAAFWEFGFHGSTRVRSHNRLITQAFGNAISPLLVRVRGHSRTVNQPGKPYLRPAYERHKQRVQELILEAMEQDNVGT